MTKADPNAWALAAAVQAQAALQGVTLHGSEPWDIVGDWVTRQRVAGATLAASATVRAWYAAEDADGPSIVPLGVGMRWPACTAWLGRASDWAATAEVRS